MIDRPIRLVVSGAGRHWQLGHIEPVLQMRSYDLVAIYDPSPVSRADTRRMAPSAAFCPSFDALLNAGADAILICGPDDTHLEQAAQAVTAGLHVLVEKPIMVSVEQAGLFRTVMDAAVEQNVVFTSCLPRRVEDHLHPYGWTLCQLPTLIKMFGDLVHVSLDFSYHEPKAAGTWREGRSLLLDHFPHDGDFAYKLVCAAQGVESLPMRAWRLKDDDPLQYAVSGTIGGLPFMSYGTRYEPGENTFAERIMLRFQRGVCTVSVSRGDVELYWFGSGERELTRITPINQVAGGYYHRSRQMMEAFAAAIRADKGGHAYLTADELTMAAEAGAELLESGMYFRR